MFFNYSLGAKKKTPQTNNTNNMFLTYPFLKGQN